ncbi:monocarboxylate transporter 13-like [Sceloporus undulatus]|uniref:monocarboxylate transporter 13-like n=1 Tax=Sceloporus undulatus TaxID=8520 RepID=UPI001C4D745D|nr:monocarboxylate transporter 13-like [Sceloporus undulatus]
MGSHALSKPPDGGWGWMVVLAAFVQSALVFGVIRSFGVFLVEFMAYFEEPSSTTSWITSVTVATLMFGSPLASGLGKKFGERPLAIIGGFLSGFGLLLASFATSLAQLYVFIGLLTGFGSSLIFSPSLSLVARYFDQRRAVANALVFSGSGIASLAFSPFFQFLVDFYGWRGALLIVAGMVFNLVVCGALLRPLHLATDDTKVRGSLEAQSQWKRLVELFGLNLFFHRAFMMFCSTGMFITTGYFIPFAHLVPHAREQGFDEYQAAFLVSAVGISDIVGRIVAGGLAGWSSLRLVHNYTIWAVLTSISLLVVPLGHSYIAMVAISICYGFVASAVIPLKFSSLVEIVGMDQIMGAMGLIHMMESVGALAGPPLSGWIHDVTGSYNASFLTSGAFIAAGSLGLLLLPGFFARRPTSSPRPQTSRRT